MAVKKTKRPALRYLVSADAKLRKLSMKKLAEGQPKPTRTKRAARPKAPAASAAESLRWPWTASPGTTISLAIAGVVVAATLITATQMAGPEEPSATPVSEARFASEPMPPAPLPEYVEKPATPAKRPFEPAKSPAAKPATVPTVATEAPVMAAPVMEDSEDESVTITGCLVKNATGFSLKDASGAAVPKTRSWRSGFFKKSLPRLTVVAAAPSLTLASYDGERVSMTGVLADRELRARSVRRIAATCN